MDDITWTESIRLWFQDHENIQGFVIFASAVLVALIIELFIRRIVVRFIQSTKTDLDDEILRRVRHPLAVSVIFVGIHYSLVVLIQSRTVHIIVDAALLTFAVVLWTAAATRIAAALARRTKTEVDDEVIDVVRKPLVATVVLIGVRIALASLRPSDAVIYVGHALLVTFAVVFWTRALNRIGKILLQSLAGKLRLVEPRTMPLFEIVVQTIVYAGAAYAILLAWHVDVTAWLASAGIVGIAVGFAARDTLANLFAGIFIIADAPYKVGDFINLDSGERGKVTNIGVRSTRILTRDDVEITVPNASLGNAKIVNESGGRHEKERVRVNIGVAYGSDINKVREVLMDVARNAKYVSKDIEPRVRFRTFGDSSLNFQLMGWIAKPVLRGRALDELHTTVYNRFMEEGIQIPFPQRDVWIKDNTEHERDDELDQDEPDSEG